MDFGSSHDGEKHKLLDRDIREMISSLTRRLSDLQHAQKQPSTTTDDGHLTQLGAQVIMLAGTNTGAAMRGELDHHHHHHKDKSSGSGNPHLDGIGDDDEGLGTYVNSNFQSVNNSIMMGGSYTSNDPGVHMDVSDYSLSHQGQKRTSKKKVVKGKEKGSEHFRSDEYSSSSSTSD